MTDTTIDAETQAEATVESPVEEELVLDTYFIVGTVNGDPVVYLESDVPGLGRRRIASHVELRRIIETVSSELHLRAVAVNVISAMQEIPPPPTQEEEIKRRVEAAMAARQGADGS